MEIPLRLDVTALRAALDILTIFDAFTKTHESLVDHCLD